MYKNIWEENVIQISEDNLFEEIEDLYQVIELWGPGPGQCGIMGINNSPSISHQHKPNLRSKPANLLHFCDVSHMFPSICCSICQNIELLFSERWIDCR